jgi:hypothetical protein
MKADWTRCGKILGPKKPRCEGIRVTGARYCWEHLEPDQRSDALEALAPGKDLDLRGTAVRADVLAEILDRLRERPGDSIRIGEARCERAIFVDEVSFANVTFSRAVSFKYARFTGGVAFTKAAFADNADFSACIFGGNTVFADAEFGGTASFDSAQFGLVRLSAITAGTVSFDGARAAGEFTVGPELVAKTLTLDRLRAAGPVDVRAEVTHIACRNAEFTERVRFRLTGGRLSLVDTVFSAPATVESAGATVAVDSLQGVDAEHLTLANADLSRCLVSSLRRPEQLRLEGYCEFASAPRGLKWRYRCLPWRWTARSTLFEENLWRARHQEPSLGWSAAGQPAGLAPLDAARLAVLYRQLRRAVEDARNEPGAADLYYGEMEMRRLSTRRWDERFLLTAYWLVSGYGLRASRALLVLALLLAAAAELLQRIGFPGPTRGYVDYLLYAAGSTLSLDLAGHLPGTLTDWGQVVRMILRIAGPVLLGLGALAVRGRIKR